jgi:magnesium-transporting ATPase (P-type)
MLGAHTTLSVSLCMQLLFYYCATLFYSPLTEEIRSFVFITGAIAFILAIVLFAVGLAVNVSFVNALTIAIGIFVAFALTGMPMTVSVTFATHCLHKYIYLSRLNIISEQVFKSLRNTMSA